MTFARITLVGEVQATPEKRFTPNNTAIASFGLVVTPPARGTQASLPFTVKVTSFGRLAESVSEQVQMGQAVLVEGRLVVQSHPADDGGAPKKVLEVEANNITITTGTLQPLGVDAPVGSNYSPRTASSPSIPSQQPVMAGAAAAPTSPSGNFFTDDDIPF
ncbi:MAG: single-stranded DNA-binding protein [Vampirovibrionales bacterium]|nr:single-stranded DNA-binding protein [Vampirovibrionales bacterium]